MLKIRRIKTDKFKTAAFWIEKRDNEYIACRTLVNALLGIASPSIMSRGQEALKKAYETRRKNIYAQEMTTEQHIQLLEALRAHSGSVVLSGYANEIYDNMLHDWKRIEKRALAERGQTRTEILWIKNAKGGEEP